MWGIAHVPENSDSARLVCGRCNADRIAFTVVWRHGGCTTSCGSSVSKSSETGNVVTEYCLQFRDKNVSPDYVESRLSFNEATGLLIVVQNFGWTDDKLPRIVEHYAYRSIDQAATLNDNDFDETNSAYEFVAR